MRVRFWRKEGMYGGFEWRLGKGEREVNRCLVGSVCACHGDGMGGLAWIVTCSFDYVH